MPRTLRVASIQMDSAPSPTDTRLTRAGDLIAEAASAGASLIVLPEVFNTGYEYHDRNYELAEPMDGATVTWMKQIAKEHNIYLAGTLLLLDEEDIYNTALLIAPDGQTWRYDKQFPFLWERAYFREGENITIADTEFGKLGMMICWDASHAEVWARYAGKVDAMIVMSNPPKFSSADLIFPDNERVNMQDLGIAMEHLYTEEEFFPGADMDAHAAWMRVPVIATSGAGEFRSRLPMAKLTLASYLTARPDLWSHLNDADDVWVESTYDKQTKIVDKTGEVLARVSDDGDGFTLAEIELADETPQPLTSQPKMRTSWLAYLMVDTYGTNMMTQRYRRMIRKYWGEKMAPLRTRTIQWGIGVLIAGFIGMIIGRLSK